MEIPVSGLSRVSTSWISGKRTDHLFLCFCSSMPPISWHDCNKELIYFPSADGSVVKVEPKIIIKSKPTGSDVDALLKFAWFIEAPRLCPVSALRCFTKQGWE